MHDMAGNATQSKRFFPQLGLNTTCAANCISSIDKIFAISGMVTVELSGERRPYPLKFMVFLVPVRLRWDSPIHTGEDSTDRTSVETFRYPFR